MRSRSIWEATGPLADPGPLTEDASVDVCVVGAGIAGMSVAYQLARPMFTVPSLAPGDTRSRCIRITYSGSLAAGVRLYASSSGALAPLLNLVVTRGTDSAASFPSCSGFSPDPTNYVGSGPGVLYLGPLSSYPANWGSGIVDPQAIWASGEAHSYRFELALANDPSGQGRSAAAEFTWEARNE